MSIVSHEKIKEALKSWKLENEKLTDVGDSACYVGEDYVIKISQNLGYVENHISLSLAIESVGLLTATPIKTRDDKYVVAEGELYFYVTKRLTGQQLKASLQSAKEWAIPTLSKKMGLPKKFIEKYGEVFGEIYEFLPQQIIHRDINPGNLIISENNCGIIDFELSERNIRIFDPCYAAVAILSESFDPDNTDKMRQWIEVYKNIMYGYDGVVKLSDNEWKAIPYVMITNQFISTAWFSEQESYRELYEINRKMTEWMLMNFDELTL